jgi:hypothetical protein
MGLKIETDGKAVTVVRKDGVSQSGKAYTMYSLMYSFKNSNEEWKNVFVDCQFRKGTDLANKSKINITNAFMTGSEYNGNTKPKIFVLDYEVVEGGNQPAPAPSGDMGFVNIPDGLDTELPFA